MKRVFEESTENFTARWRSEAADVRIFPRVENDPMLELEAGGVILQALERTGPYLPQVGPGRAIIHAFAQAVEQGPEGACQTEVTGISRARFQGRVTRREPGFLVVDVGFSLVAGFLEEPGDDVQVGSHVQFEALPPLHAFILVDSVHRSHDMEV